ncbi:hypothetical protein [Agrobacterium rosae]|uniref:hypothetical protein n=1 Tax=Agrobacterium rosae TaxID=1972867 RepID=UPI003BA030DB
MKLNVLDSFEESGAVCYLCRTTLEDYIQGLPENFRDFYIQRGIVSNKFLDNLWDTVFKRKHIPAIVLVSSSSSPDAKKGESFELDSNLKVLDGLQRSHRLREIWDAAQYIKMSFVDDPMLSPARLARKYADSLKEAEVSSSIFQKMIDFQRQNGDIEALFHENKIWLEVWFNLTESQQIQKMLILNAGHKSVNIKHQIELLFWGSYSTLQKALSPSHIVREKDKSSTSYSKNREPGEFHFAHIISAFVSLTEGKSVTTNADYSAAMSFEQGESLENDLFEIDDKTLNAFAATLSILDHSFQDAVGVRWLGREVVLVGIFGAIGAFAKTNSLSLIDSLAAFNEKTSEFVQILNLEQFEHYRNRVELSKVNIGNVNKKAVFEATARFLDNRATGPVNWQELFEKQA